MSRPFDHHYSRPPERRFRRAPLVALVLVLVVGVLAGAWYLMLQRAPESRGEPPRSPALTETPPPAAAPGVQHPIELAKPEASALPALSGRPALEESDGLVANLLSGAVGSDALARFVVGKDFVRRVVATVDNLPRERASQRMWPVKPTEGRFATTRSGDSVYLSAANAARYEPFLRAMEAADSGKLVAAYVKLYPLFDRAYKDLGYPNGYFNDRLVEVIDHLLATPEVSGPIQLSQPWVLQEYADPSLESRSAGQKAMLRMGTENALRVKAKLREIRRQVTGGEPAQ